MAMTMQEMESDAVGHTAHSSSLQEEMVTLRKENERLGEEPFLREKIQVYAIMEPSRAMIVKRMIAGRSYEIQKDCSSCRGTARSQSAACAADAKQCNSRRASRRKRDRRLQKAVVEERTSITKDFAAKTAGLRRDLETSEAKTRDQNSRIVEREAALGMRGRVAGQQKWHQS